MDPIRETHVSEPGLLVVDVAAAADATVLAFQQLLADRWATATAEQTWTRDAVQSGRTVALLSGPASAAHCRCRGRPDHGADQARP
ncbi:DUF6207 family protein [Streptomyces hawaiiensis]|uniref:DUF6207 family protein n=1 Tax=Streptomyces hawaiiensis TaxID=67305 RepID=UPI001FEC7158|nr:DUF6207 family protein [Streptomyces hawaiiensis]